MEENSEDSLGLKKFVVVQPSNPLLVNYEVDETSEAAGKPPVKKAPVKKPAPKKKVAPPPPPAKKKTSPTKKPVVKKAGVGKGILIGSVTILVLYGGFKLVKKLIKKHHHGK